MKITYQDPCRPGLYMGIFDAPHEVLKSLTGIELPGMEHHGQDAVCRGVSSWVSCGATAKSIRLS